MLGHNAIPAGSRALKRLEEKKIPYILLTNGGGKGEADRVTELSGRLGVNVCRLFSRCKLTLDFSESVNSEPYPLQTSRP